MLNKSLQWVRRHWGWSLLFVTVAALAGTTYADFLKAVGQRESSMNQYAVNKYGYAGLYQMGSLALQDAGYKTSSGAWTGKDGVTSQAGFLANAQAQTNAITAYYQKAWSTIQYYGLDRYVGQTVNGVPITASGLLAGYHLLGIGNAANPGLKAFLQNGTVGMDANGTTIASYIKTFGGYSLPVSGTTYASVAAATPTGGVTISSGTSGTPTTLATPTPASLTGPSLLGDTSLSGASPSAVYADPMAGFSGGSGQTMRAVQNLLALLAGAAALTWLAYAIHGLWMRYADGVSELHEMTTGVVRAMVVVMLIVALIW